MRYMLTFVVDESANWERSPEEMRAAIERWKEFDREAVQAGALIANDALEDSSSATTVEVKDDGERVVTDGPFSESKEQLGGFCLLECENLDEALAWAKKIPLMTGHIEVRPVRDLSSFGYESPTPGPAKATA
jgi:hypothetical protein